MSCFRRKLSSLWPLKCSVISNILDFVAIASTGDAQDFGHLQTALRQKAALSSATRGIFSGGYTPTPSTSFKDEIIPDSISRIRYEIDLNKVSDFKIENNEIFELISNS